MNFVLLLLLETLSSLEINTNMGYAKAEAKEKLLITNGVFPVDFNLQFENQLINIDEATLIGNSGVRCGNLNSSDLIREVNDQLSDAFWLAFEPLEIDLRSKDRSQRGAFAAAAMTIGLTVGEKLLGKAIDYLFDSRGRKTAQTVNELRASLHTIKNDLELSAIELCAFSENVLIEKINRIGTELSLSIENQIKNEIQKLYFGDLNNNYKMLACLELNTDATKFDCLKIIRSTEFVFNIIAIDLQDNFASIKLQILTPILSKSIIGYRFHNIGLPIIRDSTNFILKASLPNFITSKHEYIFKSKPNHNVIEENALISNPQVDYDCFKNTTEFDNQCDASIEMTSSNYIIKHIEGYTVLINFVTCSYTNINVIDEPTFLNVGTHIVKFNLGFLTCGEERISFGHKSINVRKHVSYNNFTTKFNFVEPKIFKNIHNYNIIDNDHILEQVSVFPYISLRVIILVLIISFITTIVVILVYLYKRGKVTLARLAPPALVY